LKEYWRIDVPDFWNPVHDGKLVKGKVHCSCWMCRRKSYDALSQSDRKKAAAACQMLQNSEEGDADESLCTAK